jgi:SAM-dependent methyltransferase
MKCLKMTFSAAHTGFRSLPYRSGIVYNFVNDCLYDRKEKYSIIAKLVGKGPKTVLDLPCGTGYLMKFLHPLITYTGFDLNHRFLKKIKNDWNKGKIRLNKIVLKQYNIFDFEKYPKEKQDVIVFCDILHHVYDENSQKHLELVENAKKHAKKIIICEPVAIRPQDINAHDILGKSVMKITKFFPERIIKILDFFLADNDGINSYSKRASWKHNENTLRNLYHKMGFNKIYTFMDDFIGVWESNGVIH